MVRLSTSKTRAPMKSLIQLLRKASALPVLLASASLFILMVMTFFDVLLRSAFNAPIEAATELTRILMAVMVFSIMPIISARREHITVDLTDYIFNRYRLAKIRDGLVTLACGVMLIWPTMRVYVLAERARSYGDVTEYIGIPQFYIGWFIAIATGLTAFVLIAEGLVLLFKPKLLEATR